MTGDTPSRALLVTGAAGGLGTVMTTALLAAGHAVAALDRDAAALKRLTAVAAPHHDRFLALQADLADPAQCADAVIKTAAHFGRLEGLINNAGIGMSAIRPDAEKNHPGIAELSAGLWDSFFALNVRAPMLLAQGSLPHMRDAGWGRIVNNTTSFRTMLRVLPYGATKSALESMSAVWADELKNSAITVNVLVPGGPTDTPFIADEAGWPREQMLRPAIMGPPAVWLMSDASDNFTGMRITAADWDASRSASEAARGAARPIGWPDLADQTAWWPSGQ
ncbi:MAG TPA: SDR family oxidoreductase [Pseudolabrys sp.]|nr:SDR family oxidoreductase [Pseudolabrys sp.]